MKWQKTQDFCLLVFESRDVEILISPRLTTWKVRLTSYLSRVPFLCRSCITLFTSEFDIEFFLGIFYFSLYFSCKALSKSVSSQNTFPPSTEHHKLFIKSNFLESFWSLIDIFIICFSSLASFSTSLMSRRIHHVLNFFGRFSPKLFFVFISNEKLFFTQRVFFLCLMRQYRLKTWRWFRCFFSVGFLLCFFFWFFIELSWLSRLSRSF